MQQPCVYQSCHKFDVSNLVAREVNGHVFSYLVLLHLTVEGKPVGEVVASLVTTDGQPNKNKYRPASMPQSSMS